MPQMNKGGKFIFGKSMVNENGTIQIPTQAIEEYKSTHLKISKRETRKKLLQ